LFYKFRIVCLAVKKGKMAKYNIYLFRHGQTTYNRDGRFTGWKESKLTPLGIRQAKALGKRLKHKKIDIAFQSKLSRSKDTLKEVLKFHPECRKIITDDRMIERSYGDLNGVSHEEFIRKIGHQEYDLLKEGDAIENFSSENRKKVEKFLGEEEFKLIHRGYNIPPPGGESFADVEKRVRDFILWLKKYVRKNKVNVAISAHGNSIRLFRKIMEKASKEEVIGWFIPYDEVFHYVINV
jgi:2,3-bisphosphoglycerate-dependent phosphoglycerate mutase